jgi:hypothetical protein
MPIFHGLQLPNIFISRALFFGYHLFMDIDCFLFVGGPSSQQLRLFFSAATRNTIFLAWVSAAFSWL